MASPLVLACLLLAVAASLPWGGSPAALHPGEDDVRCLQSLKAAISDPSGHLSDWNFRNSTAGFICIFAGISCWNDQQNRVLAIELGSMALSGQIPSALQYCSGTQTLDLSSNSFYGQIPPALCDWLPYLVTLDLSNNNLVGPIPSELSNCQFLNSLILDFNQLNGSIPASIARLNRLKTFSISDNQLTGAIPSSLSMYGPFSGNPGLCGSPLSSCGEHSKTSLVIIIAAGVFGATASIIILYAVWRWWLSPRKGLDRPADRLEDGRSWVAKLRSSHHRLMPVSLFQKPLVKVRLADILVSTGDFHQDSIIAAGGSWSGTSYKAVLRDGSALTVKRLHGSSIPEKQFRYEIGRLGEIRHPNLVPLLGFCVVEDERLLIYKNMANGDVFTLLSSVDCALDWPMRLKIGITTARGLAWLHHGFDVPFLHQNVSSCAVLLDEDYEARVTDFGVTRLLKTETSNGARLFVNSDFGDFGYVAPEYATSPLASMKGDVFAFGVVLLELVTGQRPTEIRPDVPGEVSKGNLVDWVNEMSTAGHIRTVVDRSLQGKGHDEEIMQFLRVAVGCIASRPKDRFSMLKVYQSLKSIGEQLDLSEQFEEFPLNFNMDDTEVF